MQRMQRLWRHAARAPRYLGTAAAAPPLAPRIEVTPSCAARLAELTTLRGHPVALRITVDGGGCSGFQYLFDLERAPPPEDRLSKDNVYVDTADGACVVCDNLSLEYIAGSKVDYVTELISSSFRVTDNPNSEGSCGCGVSFAAKG